MTVSSVIMRETCILWHVLMHNFFGLRVYLNNHRIIVDFFYNPLFSINKTPNTPFFSRT
jgi:hypothetical protein